MKRDNFEKAKLAEKNLGEATKKADQDFRTSACNAQRTLSDAIDKRYRSTDSERFSYGAECFCEDVAPAIQQYLRTIAEADSVKCKALVDAEASFQQTISKL